MIFGYSYHDEELLILPPIRKRYSGEQEVLHALAKGYSYQQIADRLYISIETVRTYLRKIYTKLQVHSKVDALNKVFPRE